MKRYILLLSILLGSFCAQNVVAQQQPARIFFNIQNSNIPSDGETPSGSTYRGVWGIGDLNTNEIRNNGNLHTEAAWKGYLVTRLWSDVETSDNTWNFTDLDAAVKEVKDSGLHVGVKIQVGPASPTWLMTLAGTYTTQGGANTYPRYYSPAYKSRYWRLYDTIAKRYGNKVDVIDISIGKTGDTGPHVGDPDGAYASDPYVPQGENTAWTNFTYDSWDSCYTHIVAASPSGYTHMLVNTGNDHQNNRYVYDRYNRFIVWVKEGRLSHNYSFDGGALYTTLPLLLDRGEVQGYIYVSSYPHKDGFQNIVSASDENALGIFNTPEGWRTNITGNDIRYNAFYNRYANDTIAATSRHAFVQLALPISIDSVGRWSETTYGKLIPDASLSKYNSQIATINSNTSWSSDYKAYRRMLKVVQFANPTRITNLVTTIGTGTTALYNRTSNFDYDNDFLFSSVNNYSRFIKQVGEGHPEFRVGPDTSIYGRFAKSFTTPLGTSDMTFAIASGWAFNTTISSLDFYIVYFDSGSGSWSLKADNTGDTQLETIQTITKTNTGQWIRLHVVAPNMKLAQGFALHYVSGTNTTFYLIEIENKLD